MEVHKSCRCRYCNQEINYYFTISDMKYNYYTQEKENEKLVYAYPYKQGYKVEVRCPKPFCNKVNYFEYDKNGEYLGEL